MYLRRFKVTFKVTNNCSKAKHELLLISIRIMNMEHSNLNANVSVVSSCVNDTYRNTE